MHSRSDAVGPCSLRLDCRVDEELLHGFKATISNAEAVLASWTGDDPCSGWRGVVCTGTGAVITEM